MIYSVHTFELALNVGSEKFNKLQYKAHIKAKNSHSAINDAYKCTDLALADKGVKIEYHDGTYKKKIKLIVNPSKVLGSDDVKKLWKPKVNTT